MVKFKRGEDNLYSYTPHYSTEPEQIQEDTNLVETVEQNEKFYTNRQIKRAKRAQQLLLTLGCPTVTDLKTIIKTNAIEDCPVTLGDLELAQKIYGPDIASLKGKTTRRKPKQAHVEDEVAIPQVNRHHVHQWNGVHDVGESSNNVPYS